jgi:hypothetical protein
MENILTAVVSAKLFHQRSCAICPMFNMNALHCNEKNHLQYSMYSFSGNCMASDPISSFMCLWDIYIFPVSVHISCKRIVTSIVGVYKSLGLCPRNSLSGNICFQFSDWFFAVWAVDRKSHGFVQDSERISLADDIIIKVFVLANPRVVYACTVYTENYRVSIRGFWMIYRGQGFHAFLWFGSSPPPTPLSCQQIVSLSLSSCVSPVELTGRWGRGGMEEEPNPTTVRKPGPW